MKSEKTTQAGITKLTKTKKKQLNKMWTNYQKWIQNQKQEKEQRRSKKKRQHTRHILRSLARNTPIRSPSTTSRINSRNIFNQNHSHVYYVYILLAAAILAIHYNYPKQAQQNKTQKIKEKIKN